MASPGDCSWILAPALGRGRKENSPSGTAGSDALNHPNGVIFLLFGQSCQSSTLNQCLVPSCQPWTAEFSAKQTQSWVSSDPGTPNILNHIRVTARLEGVAGEFGDTQQQ